MHDNTLGYNNNGACKILLTKERKNCVSFTKETTQHHEHHITTACARDRAAALERGFQGKTEHRREGDLAMQI